MTNFFSFFNFFTSRIQHFSIFCCKSLVYLDLEKCLTANPKQNFCFFVLIIFSRHSNKQIYATFPKKPILCVCFEKPSNFSYFLKNWFLSLLIRIENLPRLKFFMFFETNFLNFNLYFILYTIIYTLYFDSYDFLYFSYVSYTCPRKLKLFILNLL